MRLHKQNRVVFALSVILGVGLGVICIGSLTSSGKAQLSNKQESPKQNTQDLSAPKVAVPIQVELIGITDTLCKPYGIPRLSDHLWDKKGDPIYGIELRQLDTMSDHWTQTEADPKWRYVVIGATFPNNDTIEVLQHVPSLATRQPIGPAEIIPEGHHYVNMGSRTVEKRGFFIARVEKDELEKNGYTFSYARGPWKEVAVLSTFPINKDLTTLAEGEWGKFSFAASTIDPRAKYSNAAIIRDQERPLAYPVYQLENARPNDYQIRFEVVLKGSKRRGGQFTLGAKIDQIEKVIVRTRKLQHVHFDDLSANPNPKSWADIRWADEAKKYTLPIGEYGTLEGFTHMGGLYTPDGKPWRDYNLHEDFFNNYSYTPDKSTPEQRYSALLLANKQALEKGTIVRIAAFASPSNTPGKALSDKLGTTLFQNVSYTLSSIPFTRPKGSDFVHLKVEVANQPWETIGVARPIDQKTLANDLKYLDENRREGMSEYIHFEMSFDHKGHFGWIYRREGFPSNNRISKLQLVNWKPGDYDYRVVINLKGGKSAIYKPFLETTDYPLTVDFGPVKGFGVSATVGGQNISLTDIVSFTVQKRSFNAPYFVVGKLPDSKSNDLTSCVSIMKRWKVKKELEAQAQAQSFRLPTTRPTNP